MPLLAHHYQYACLFYLRIYSYFRTLLPPTALYTNVRLVTEENQEIPSNRPIGLYISHNSKLRVVIVEEECDEPFKVLFRNWKQALCIRNPQKGAYLITRTISSEQQRAYFALY